VSISSRPPVRTRFDIRDYDLAATLSSGQAFRWECHGSGWVSVIAGRWVRLSSAQNVIVAETVDAAESWSWLADYLQSQLDLSPVLAAFPNDNPMLEAKKACHGLRLLRQDPWECLASFILSSSKQIVQIQQIVRLLCERFGERVSVPPDHSPCFSFPTPERLADRSEAELRACKMGFRAAYLKKTASMIAASEVNLASLSALGIEDARQELLKLPGVGRKIADCVLLFAYGFQKAFPIDVWVTKALRELYFRSRPVSQKRLQSFTEEYFGPFGGYAQQYLFHYMRLRERRLALRKP
jgi:N-glycosylase/DNA lyase